MSELEFNKLVIEMAEDALSLPIDTYLQTKYSLLAYAVDSPKLTNFLNKLFAFVEARQPKLLPMK